MMTYIPQTYKEIVDFLANLDVIAHESSRIKLLEASDIDKKLLQRVSFSGPPIMFASEIVKTLLEYGKLANGEPALAVFLNSLLDYINSDQRERLKHLETKIDSLFINKNSHLYGLLIGVSDYVDEALPHTPTCGRDVQAIHDSLINPNYCNCLPKNLRLLSSHQATLAYIKNSLDWLENVCQNDPDATCFVYYSGNSVQFQDDFFLSAHDTKVNVIQSTTLSSVEFSTRIKRITAKRKAIFLDCSHAWAAMQKQDVLYENEKQKAEERSPYSQKPKSLITLADEFSNESGIAVIASSQPDQASFINHETGLSLFAYFLIKALEGEVDLDNNSAIRILDLFQYLVDSITNEVQKFGVEQNPALQFIGNNNFPLVFSEGQKSISQDIKTYRVFISSPGDVIPERQSALKVINNINLDLEKTGSTTRLEPFIWERTIPHTVIGLSGLLTTMARCCNPRPGDEIVGYITRGKGATIHRKDCQNVLRQDRERLVNVSWGEPQSTITNPQDVIFQESRFEEVDIFIGLLWTRFGTPTGGTRQSNGEPYLSGTEAEIDKAFEIHKRNIGNKPVIMLYRKIAQISDTADQERIEQFSRVSEYVKRFGPDGDTPSLISEFYDTKEFETILDRHLRLVVERLSENWKSNQIQREIETTESQGSKPRANIEEIVTAKLLLVTSSNMETQVVLTVFSQVLSNPWQRNDILNIPYYDLGTIADVDVSLLQIGMGITDAISNQEAIKYLQPDAIIFVGLAFGVNPQKQNLGDILVARQIQVYESQKVKGSESIPRVDRVNCSVMLLDKFRRGELNWNGSSVHFGKVLSGEKLVSNVIIRSQLLLNEPEIIGGEIEGAGLYNVTSENKMDWILVKGICDWADGSKNDKAQEMAARNAAQFVLHVLQMGKWNRLLNKNSASPDVLSMPFLDFDIEISSAQGSKYLVKAVSAPFGETEAVMELPFDQKTRDEYTYKLQIALLRSGGRIRTVVAPELKVVQDFGSALFNALFTGAIRERYFVSRSYANEKSMILRISLRVYPNELATLPWEYLYDPTESEFICLLPNISFVRIINLPTSATPLSSERINILGVIANPNDSPALDTESEKSRLEKALANLIDQGLVNLTWLEGQTIKDLQYKLQQHHWNVIHFIGHGGYNTESGEGFIVLADDEGNSRLVSANIISRLLVDHSTIRLVSLTACEGGRSGPSDIFSSVAARMVQTGIPAVIAMQFDITDRAAIEFSRSLYASLAVGSPIDVAVAEGRRSIFQNVPNSLEWGVPILYLRAKTGLLFNFVDKSVTNWPAFQNAVAAVINANNDVVGTGFFVDRKRIITSAHVLGLIQSNQPVDEISIRLHDNQLFRARLHKFSQDEDIAILELEEEIPISIQPLTLDASVGHDGSNFKSFGYPPQAGDTGLLANGEVKGHTSIESEPGKSTPKLQLSSAEVGLGFSGSPVVEQVTGHVIGMISHLWQDQETNNVAFAIPGEQILLALSNLEEKEPPFQAPPLPTNYIQRLDASQALINSLISEDASKVAPPVTINAISGMGGVGKTMLATAVAHDAKIIEYFPDGVLWATLGEEPDILAHLQNWVQAIGDNEAIPADLDAATFHLEILLREKRCLLILDDVCFIEHVKPFLFNESKSKLLITTRNKTIPQMVGAQLYLLDVLAEKQALDLFTITLGPLGEQRDKAAELSKKLGYLPLAIQIAASLIKSNYTWDEIIKSVSREETSGFRLENWVPYFNAKEIELSNIQSRIVSCLILANGGICDLTILKQAGWIDVGIEVVSSKAVYEQMRRIKGKLEIYAPGCLQNIRGKGYRIQNPISKIDKFTSIDFYRPKELDEIIRLIFSSGVVWLQGERGIGKTYILHLLEKIKDEWVPSPNTQVVYIDCEMVTDQSEFYSILLSQLGHPGKDALSFSGAIEGKSIFLLIDEAERLAELGNLPSVLRGLLQGRLSGAVLAAAVPPDNFIRDKSLSPFNVAHVVKLLPLTQEEAKEFLNKRFASEDFWATLTERKIAKVIEESKGIPGKLIQLVQKLYVRKEETESAGDSKIEISLSIPETQISVGAPAHLNISVIAGFTGEVTLAVQPADFWIQEGNNIVTATLLDGKGNSSLEIIPRSAGEHIITVQAFYNHKRQSSTKLKVTVIADQKQKLELPDPLGPRSVPQPDLCIRVYQVPIAEEGFRLEYMLYSPHYSLHLPGTPTGSANIKRADIARLMGRLDQVLQENGDALTETLSAVGQALFDILFPSQLKAIYQEIHDRIKNILILSDPSLWIPWELVKPHGVKWEHDFLASRYHIGRWLDGWGALRLAEFPIGQVCYVPGAGIVAENRPADEWCELFGEHDLPRLGQRLFERCPGGYAAAMAYETPIWGLHFETLSERLGMFTKEVIALGEELTVERIREYILDLHAKRPLVTFGSLTNGPETALSEVETRWLPTFIQSGASAFVSVLWSTALDADKLFWQTFYHAIWSKYSLGEAVYLARQAVKQTFPNTWDWLAYYLVGDPMSIGYIPRPGDGFITLECVNHDLAQPLVVGKRYNFVASLRDLPPPWYRDRLYQSTMEEWMEPAVQVFAPEFTISPGPLIKLEEPVSGVRYARFDIIPQRPEPADLFVHFLSGHNEVRHSLSFSIEVQSRGRAI